MGGVCAKTQEASDANAETAKIKGVSCDCPCMAGVAGGLPTKIFFYFLCLCAFAFFVWSLIPKSGEWQANKVELKQTVVDETTWPDMYFCMSARDTWMTKTWPLPPTVPTGYTAPGAGDTRISLQPQWYNPTDWSKKLETEIGFDKNVHSCPLFMVDDSYTQKTKCAGTIKSLSSTVGTDFTAEDKANLQALTTARSRNIKGTKEWLGVGAQKAEFKVELTDTTVESAGCSQLYEVYFVEPGKAPVKNGQIDVPMELVPANGYMSIVSLAYNLVKDLTNDKNAKFQRKYFVQKETTMEVKDGGDGYDEGSWAFRVNNFHVDEVTIRKHGFSDIWTDLGGMWAASLILVAVFFGVSSQKNSKGEFPQMFRFYPQSVKNSVTESLKQEEDNNKSAL